MTRPPDPDAGRLQSGGDGEAWDRAMREAVDWTILLDDDPDDADLRARFEQWRSRDPLHEQTWAEASHASGLIAQSRKVAFLPTASSPRKPRAHSQARARTGFRSRRRTFVAAAVAAAVAFLAAPQVMLNMRADYVTGTAQQRTVTLDDGTAVRLAPDSALRIAYSGDSRNVTLLSGEAYFEVRRDPARPFQVVADNASVTVLGTGFDVRLGDRGTDVAVKHGRVRVAPIDRQNGSVILEGGQWAHMPRGGAVTSGNLSPELVGGWTEGRITAVDRPLSEVVADLRRYHRGAIVLTNEVLGRESVTGTFEVADPAAAAELIVQPHGGVVRRITPWLIVISAS